ncbi:MaoC/PaaZ C-terminal domain-containing protein [Candidatus Poriferisocius sp.]|uniref:MaoC/PaaZ C-terminal domain-containing protein n=1 Tax=Candidatus Poriferisocius sp. TaxID=3101276 RepID=UPI003B5A9809
MPLDPTAVGTTSEPRTSSWHSKDALLYALGVGAGTTDPTGFELEFTTENTNGVTQKALPTMCVVLGGGLAGPDSPLAKIGTYNPALLVHGEQGFTLHKPLPVAATVSSVSRVAGIYDKGKAALVVLETEATDTADDQPLFTTSSSLFIRGEGGWGGDRGPAGPEKVPERAADHVVTYHTRPDQALLYRLNGDRNPLHSDPSFAAAGGFDTPILHGLCTYGFTGRALLHTLCDSDPTRFGAMHGRFSSPVLPGETLDVHIWEQADGPARFQTRVGDRVVLDAGTVTVS